MSLQKSIQLNLTRQNKKERELFDEFSNLEERDCQVVEVRMGDNFTYSHLVRTRDLMKLNLSMLKSAKLIELPKLDFALSQSLIKGILDKFFMFLCTGYLDIAAKDAMLVLYMALELRVRSDVVKQLLITLPRTEHERLWIVLLRIFNQDRTEANVEYARELMEKNPDFLIDPKDNNLINPNLRNLKSLLVMEKFLKTLVSVVTEKQRYEVSVKDWTLVETLLKWYIYENRLPAREYSIQRINKIVGDNIAQEARQFDVNDVQSLLNELKRKEQKVKSLEEEYNREEMSTLSRIRELDQQIHLYKQKMSRSTLPPPIPGMQQSEPRWQPPPSEVSQPFIKKSPQPPPRMQIEDEVYEQQFPKIQVRKPQAPVPHPPSVPPPAVQYNVKMYHAFKSCDGQNGGTMLACNHVNCNLCAMASLSGIVQDFKNTKNPTNTVIRQYKCLESDCKRRVSAQQAQQLLTLLGSESAIMETE